ncbi:hypothetical protein J41TS2_41700 [Bacillus sonorensis]|nr:hypothetical protein J41TS2_41700 [Bacillus sonorensis]
MNAVAEVTFEAVVTATLTVYATVVVEGTVLTKVLASGKLCVYQRLRGFYYIFAIEVKPQFKNYITVCSIYSLYCKCIIDFNILTAAYSYFSI